MIEAVENQIRENTPPFVSKIYEILQWRGYSKQEAKEKLEDMLASEEIYEDEDLYEDETGIWVGFGKILNDAYEQFEEQIMDVVLQYWILAWERLKENMKGAYKKP